MLKIRHCLILKDIRLWEAKLRDQRIMEACVAVGGGGVDAPAWILAEGFVVVDWNDSTIVPVGQNCPDY